MKKVIVTGASGFLGQAVVQSLSDQGTEVLAVMRECHRNSTPKWGGGTITPVYCELSQLSHLPEQVDCCDVDAFYHFAWAGTSGNQRGDEEIQLNNVKCTCDGVRVAKQLGCNRFILAASIMEYECYQAMCAGSISGLGSIYSAGKLAADGMARVIADDIGIDYSAVVISNIYGPGELSARLINTTIRALLEGKAVPCTAGEQMYDFVYLADAATAFARLGTAAPLARRYYLGSGTPRPLKEFLLQLQSTVPGTGTVELGAVPVNGLSLDYSQFETISIWKQLNLHPKTDFATGILKTAEWIQGEH